MARNHTPLALLSAPALKTAAELGRLMDAHEIAEHVLFNKVSWRWVLENVPRELRRPTGNKVCYYENEVRAWHLSLAAA